MASGALPLRMPALFFKARQEADAPTARRMRRHPTALQVAAREHGDDARAGRV